MSTKQHSDQRKSGKGIPKDQKQKQGSAPHRNQKGHRPPYRTNETPRWDTPQEDPRRQPGYTPDKDPNLNPSSDELSNY